MKWSCNLRRSSHVGQKYDVTIVTSSYITVRYCHHVSYTIEVRSNTENFKRTSFQRPKIKNRTNLDMYCSRSQETKLYISENSKFYWNSFLKLWIFNTTYISNVDLDIYFECSAIYLEYSNSRISKGPDVSSVGFLWTST